MKKILFLLIASSLLYSCVPYKKIVYIQGELPDKNMKQQDYVIKKNDILFIEISSPEESAQRVLEVISGKSSGTLMDNKSLFFKGYTVNNDGYIDIPIIHRLFVVGKNYEQVKEIIREALRKKSFKNTNNIAIKVKLAGIPYTVLGEVSNPQSGVLYKENPTLFDVLGEAGDITMVGDRRNISIIRNEGDKTVKVDLDITDASVIASPYYYVRPNDIIYVKPLRQKTLGTGTTLQQTISTTITALSLITTIILLSKYTK